jgi:hypothetical protein
MQYLLDPANAEQICDGDELRNINSYEYLKILIDKVNEDNWDLPTFLEQMPSVKELLSTFNQTFNPRYPYGDLYTKFILAFENEIENRKANGYQLHHIAKEVIKLIYANPNKALERTAKMIQTIMNNKKHTSSKIVKSVTHRMMGDYDSFLDKLINLVNYIFRFSYINKITPHEQDSLFKRLHFLFSSTLKSQSATNLASIRTYDYQTKNSPKEYRFGTQGQYHYNKARISPLFEAWLDISESERRELALARKRPKGATVIGHIYFNNLALERDSIEGRKENKLTNKLHTLEEDHPNIAVITLPSDKGLMSCHLIFGHRKTYTYHDAYQEMFNLVIGKESTIKPRDFYISARIKNMVYGGSMGEVKIVKELLKKSFKKFGFTEFHHLSPADRQAVYFHFIKYELTNHIIEKLKPDSFNMTCKDAIDRGAVSSAYYNLLKSLETDKPLSKDEFYRSLHAASTLVKGRGMNHHSKLIWNTIDAYIRSQEKQNNQLNKTPWLKEWRDAHTPPFTKQYYILQLEALLPSVANQNLIKLFESGARSKYAATKLVLDILKGSHIDDKVSTDALEITLKELKKGSLRKITKEAKKYGLMDVRMLVTYCLNERKHAIKPSSSL